MLLLLLWTAFLVCVDGHAIFWEPPSRASLGKYSNNFCKVPINDDHMSLYCGGILVQHQQNGGKCGLCGDTYNSDVHPHQVVGTYATGTITRSYFQPGQVIDVIIDIVANHNGFFAFRLCPNDNPDKDPQPECFDKYRLKFENGDDIYFVPKVAIPRHEGAAGTPPNKAVRVTLRLRLPEGLTCWQCLLQWTWVAGNNWGMGAQMADFSTEDCRRDKEGKMGCGPQETFRGCADICIGPGCPKEECQRARPFSATTTTATTPATASTGTTATTVTPATTASPATATATTATTATTTSTPAPPPPQPDQICTETGIKDTFFSLEGSKYCKETCLGQPMKFCNLYICYCNTRFFKEIF